MAKQGENKKKVAGKASRSADKAPSKTPQKQIKQAKKTTAPVKTQRKPWWKVALSAMALLIWVGVIVIASQLIVGYLMLWILGRENFSQPVVTAIYSALSYILAMILIIFVPPKVSVKWKIVNEKESGTKVLDGKKAPKATSRKELGLTGLPTWTDIGLAVAGFIVYLVLAAAFIAVFTWLNERGIFPWFDANEAQDVGFSTYSVGMDRLVAFITLVVVAPIAEEIIFRGWLYGKLRAKLSAETTEKASVVVSTLLVSLLFGLVHMQWNVGVNVFAMSLVLCALREFTGTIHSGILLHMIKNGVAFYLLFVMGIG